MKSQFVSKLLCTPWHIGRDRGRTIIGSMLVKLRAERPDEDIFGDPLPKMQILGDVAIIPLSGTLMLNVPDWVKAYGFGLTDANDIEQELDRAVNDPAVSFVLLDVDSPGGESIAGNKLFDLVETANRKKPVFAWCSDGALMCSAAYNAAAPCPAIYAGKYATLGSIGSYLAFLDDSEFWKMLGLNWEVFRSGDMKGIGEDALSEDQRAYLQSITDESGARIRRNVTKYRTGIAEEDMQGQWFQGDVASSRGFSAGTAKDIGTAISKFRRLF